MKHLQRIHLLTALLIPVVSLGTGAFLLSDIIVATTEVRLDTALALAKDGARQNATWQSLQDENEKIYVEAKKQLQELGREKRVIRLQIGTLLGSIKNIGNRRDALLLSRELTVRNFDREQENFGEFLRDAHMRQLDVMSGPAAGGEILRRLLGTSLGDSTDADLRDAALEHAREQILARLLISWESDAMERDQLRSAAGPMGKELVKLRDRHMELRSEYNDTLHTLDAAERNIRASAEQLEQLTRDTAQVQADILSLQSELDRIDGRLRSKAERELVQKGLMEDRPERFRQNRNVGRGQFLWPLTGPVSAGFHNAHYQKFFGMPHEGIDIVTGFGTPVAAASDGIVFAVRLGGAKGYTYVVIGHRGGYATVYGHLSDVTVHAGDTVSAGQVIGSSGGTPGTEGAGRMTTGAHLHFEMIVRGEHIDPVTVLP